MTDKVTLSSTKRDGCHQTRHVPPWCLWAAIGWTGVASTQAQSDLLDFSSCGYAQSSVPIPVVQAKATVSPGAGDDGARIQAAIDYVSGLEPDGSGFRGAVVLGEGRFEVADHLEIRISGVVLRGSGKTTSLVATGPGRRALIEMRGVDDRNYDGEALQVIDDSVPEGSFQLKLEDASNIVVGDPVLIRRPSTEAWIKAIGMDREGIAWKSGTRNLHWERTVTSVDGTTVQLDAPITMALEAKFGGGTVQTFSWPGRIRRVGVENLLLISESSSQNPKDEDHAWMGVSMENVADAWVRQVEFRGFAGSAVALWESVARVTVEDCIAREPDSEVGGYRRHTFFTMGQQTLFLRCWSEEGRHDFAVGHGAPGPNAFVDCEAHRALGWSGPIESWACGVLYDNVRIDGADLRLANHWTARQGAGWSAANCVVWQSSAAEVHCFHPPTARNQAFGIWGRPVGDGDFSQRNEFVKPGSLFVAQLTKRLGEQAATDHLGPVGRGYFGATNPTYEEAEGFVAQSHEPGLTLRDIIEAAGQRRPLQSDWAGAVGAGDLLLAREVEAGTDERPLVLKEGRLLIGDAPLRGGRFTPIWWRGCIRPGEAPDFGPALTRFVPGRHGLGFTDDLDEVADFMATKNDVLLEHHHGLWYDRRRDDHEMIRRSNGDVSPPFYEQPFARSGEGTAWDGLSRYDLTRFNPWYWNRLKKFAEICDRRGLVLLQQHYFQHNLLEAGAHWADFPWRTANNINETGFPEPPPYISDKRIFQTHLFYDVTHPARRALHRGYIRQCLATVAGNTNVIHSIGAEFTGPLAFMEFWIDTIAEWEQETGRNVFVSLSCTKDVQDAILEDPRRGSAVSIIDIRYWWYQSDGELYAPAGGLDLSPRQHFRQLKPKEPDPASREKAIREYRERYPEKAVLFRGEPS